MEEQYTSVEVVNPSRRLSRTVRILSAGAKGGPGKSFLVKNLSGAAAAEGYNVAVVDFDKQHTLT
jgi:cellulose biosynthesis protein BcsQ